MGCIIIHFDDIKDRVIEYLREHTNENVDADLFYVIRDVYGRISIFIPGTCSAENLEENIHELIGEKWVGQIRNIDETNFLYNEIIKNVKKISANIYYGERPLVKTSASKKELEL